MARKSKWNKTDRKKLLKMVQGGVAEQDIREQLGDMSSVQFSQQLKTAMVEAGQLKQASRGKKASARPVTYSVTAKGRLTISDFAGATGFKPGAKFTLEKPRGKSKAWRILPV